jgi:hypothetical protein
MANDAAPEGWEEVFRGPCLQADLIVAILESNGLEPVRQQLSPQGWWSGSVMEDCQVYVMLGQAEAARRALTEAKPEPDPESEPEG